MINRILVAYDGTDLSERVFELALDLAVKYSAELTIINVIPRIEIPPSSIIPFSPMQPAYVQGSEYQLCKSRTQLVLEVIKKTKKNYPNLNINAKLKIGDPSDIIVEVAEQDEFDLIVMGSHGTHGIKRIFLGSTSDSVRIESEVPVLLVK